jgi:hypothetical protein
MIYCPYCKEDLIHNSCQGPDDSYLPHQFYLYGGGFKVKSSIELSIFIEETNFMVLFINNDWAFNLPITTSGDNLNYFDPNIINDLITKYLKYANF